MTYKIKNSEKSFCEPFVPLSLLWSIFGGIDTLVFPKSHFEKSTFFEISEFLLIISKYLMTDFKNWNI